LTPFTVHGVGNVRFAPVDATVTLVVITPVVGSVVTFAVNCVISVSAHTLAVVPPQEHAPASAPLVSHVQSAMDEQPHTFATQAVPTALPVQLTHAPPLRELVPHWVPDSGFVVETHVPVLVLQHVVLQGCDGMAQADPHVCVPGSHASPGRQSACVRHPQVLETQALLSVPPEQSEQSACAAPQVAAAVSVAQTPLVPSGGIEQHAPLHGCDASHAEVHVPGVPDMPLHAPDVPLGHSVSDVQPHEPPPL
jgi:hypothetical protein